MLWVTRPWGNYEEIVAHDDGGFDNENINVPYGMFIESFDGFNVLGVSDPVASDESLDGELFPNRAEGWYECTSRYVIRNAEERDRIVAALNAMEFEDE